MDTFPQTFMKNVTSNKCHCYQHSGKYGEVGVKGIEYVKRSDWESESIVYFKRHFQQLNLITSPSEKNTILGTFSEWCKNGITGRKALAVNDYDSVDRSKFLDIFQSDIHNLFAINSHGHVFPR